MNVVYIYFYNYQNQCLLSVLLSFNIIINVFVNIEYDRKKLIVVLFDIICN